METIGYRKTREVIDVGSRDMHGGADGIIVDDLACCMETGKKPEATGEEGFLSAIVCLAVDEAMVQSKVVDVIPIWNKFEINYK